MNILGSVYNFLWAYNSDKDWERFQPRKHEKHPNVIVGHRYEDYEEWLITVPIDFRDAILEIFQTYWSMEEEITQFKQWVNDLQSGMYINCVYCGHRYGPREDTPVSMADVLKEHIEQCPKHPMSKLKQEIEEKDRLLEEREKEILELRSILKHG